MPQCPQCAEPVAAADRFCEGCGHDLRVRRGGTATAAVTPAGQPCPGCSTPAGSPSGPDARYCLRCGLRHRDGTDRVETDLGTLAGVSDRGRVHARNEDAMALGRHTAAEPAPALAAVVCDGVSTVRSPELASQAAVEAALDVLLGATAPAQRRTRDAVAAAARAVATLGEPGTRDAPSCTFVSALVERPDGERPTITVGWVGDSRAYWLAGAGAAEPARLLTVDHSWAVGMVAAGVLDETTAMADARAHAITRWLGADGEPEPDVMTWAPAGPGVLLLCSDGLWNYLPGAAELAAVALPAIEPGAGPLDAATALTTLALDAGGRDNITVVVIPVTGTVRNPS